MKRIVTTLLLAFLFIALGQSQNVSNYTFTNGIKGITFDSIRLHRYVPKGDGVRVFLVMRRSGTVQSKTGPVMSGGMDKIWLAALGVVDFSKDMKVVNEEVTFLKPDKIMSKEFNLMDGEGKRITDMKVIATQDDCVKSNYDLYEKYPELKEKEEIVVEASPKMYYSNTINYSMLGGKLKSFESEQNNLKEEEKVSEKKFWDEEESTLPKYDRKKDEKDMESYRNPTKQDYWSRFSDPVCDPITGNVFTHHGHIAYKTLGNKSTEMEQEVVTFDKSGKELNRTEMNFKVPHALDLRQVMVTENPSNKLQSTDCIVHVYKQNHGFGYKKTNPNPDPSARRFYQWDANGKVIADVEYKAPHENAKVVKAFHNGQNVTLLSTTGYKEAAFYTTHFAGGKLTGSETCKDDCSLSKGIGFSPTEIGGYDWENTATFSRKDGSKLMVYQLKKEMVENEKKYLASKGFVMFHVTKDGKLSNAQHIQRSEKGNIQYKVKFEMHPAGNGKFVAVMSDPLTDGTTAVDAYEIDGNTLEMKKILNLEDAAELSTQQYQKANSMVFFAKDTKTNAYKMAMLAL